MSKGRETIKVEAVYQGQDDILIERLKEPFSALIRQGKDTVSLYSHVQMMALRDALNRLLEESR